MRHDTDARHQRSHQAADARTDPDVLLARLRAADQAVYTSGSAGSHADEASPAGAAGVLHVYLGAAPGVGKTLAMLHNAHRLRAAGVDVVCGLIETHGRAETAAAIGDLEQVPQRQIAYRGVLLAEPDVDAILARAPQVCLIDELAHTNAPGSERQWRWQDVHLLVAAGIRVHTTLNVQHIDSVRDIVEAVTGVQVRETVPDTLLAPPTVVHLIDLPPEDLRQRLRAGVVYPQERARQALDGFFRSDNLTALRELALRQAADGVERDLTRFMQDTALGTLPQTGQRASATPVAPHTRGGDPRQAVDGVLVCFGSGNQADRVLRHAWRLAASTDADLHALHVSRQPLGELSEAARRAIERDIQLAEDLGAQVQVQVGQDIVAAVLAAARACNAGHIVLGHTPASRWRVLLGRSLAHELLHQARGVDIHVVAMR